MRAETGGVVTDKGEVRRMPPQGLGCGGSVVRYPFTRVAFEQRLTGKSVGLAKTDYKNDMAETETLHDEGTGPNSTAEVRESRAFSALTGGGQMGALMRAMDWSETPLGPVDTWPQSLRTLVSTCLNSRFPILIWWGGGLVKLYNDAYMPIIGSKHPGALGRRGKEVWPEIWPIIGPMLEGVLSRGEATWSENILLPLERHGFSEECYFTFSYSPVRDETGGVGGVFTAVTETTGYVVGERRLKTLQALAATAAGGATFSETCQLVTRALASNPADIPFALLYLLSEDGNSASLACSTGFQEERASLPKHLDLRVEFGFSVPFKRVAANQSPVLVEEGEWVSALSENYPEGAPARSLVLPIPGAGGQKQAGFLVAGLSPKLLWDEQYQGFLNLVAGHVASSISKARVFEDEKKRAEALAEIDRAKTTFFSNVSHELRTPLTLILGPIDEILRDSAHPLPPHHREQMELMERSGARLLRLVNGLLDFSRIEAGRLKAHHEPTDLSALTADLASTFRSAIERAALKFEVTAPPLPGLVNVDREMWEKIVFNLLSNALKFTLNGSISISLRATDTQVELRVQDTGVGIPEAELPHLFERFYRVQGTKGRSVEGTGIGLSLVQELVKLHGGTVHVESKPQQGSAFIVRLPLSANVQRGNAPAPLASVSTSGAKTFLQEAAQWLPGQGTLSVLSRTVALKGRILLADDNADMRSYLIRILTEAGWSVDVASDGLEALQVATGNPPDLIVSDVMMPGLDGFALLRKLKESVKTRSIPVILLSARAGEEAATEGISGGATDYLVKPFSARDLLSRVEARVQVARAVADAEQSRARLHSLFESAPAMVCMVKGPAHVFEMVNPLYERAVSGGRTLVGRPVAEALPEVAQQGFIALLDKVYRTGEPFVGHEVPLRIARGEDGQLEDTFFTFVYQPARAPDGSVRGIDVFAFEVTEQIKARERAERLAEELRQRSDFEQQLIGIVSHDLRNPISAILMTAAVLTKREDLDAPVTKSVKRIASSAERAARMVRDLLDFTQSRLGSGIPIVANPLDVHQVVAQVVDEVQIANPEREIVSTHEGEGRGEGDADRVAQVVANLLTNAIQYSPPSTIVTVQTRGQADGVCVDVHNLGAPIPKEQLPTLFRPLQRGSGPMDRSRRSIGLGLYIVKEILNAHGGGVSVSSSPEEGTTFRVVLPRKVGSPSKETPSTAL